MELFNNFNKKFSFKNAGYQLPPIELFYSSEDTEKYEPLQIIKAILNYVKSKLNDKKIEEWSEHTRRRNPAQQIVFHLKNSIKGEFVTQAFAKFYECLSSYKMIHDGVSEKFFSVHLCECPGAFITSLNHYLKTNHPHTEFTWRATTLNPYYEGNSISNTILDDRFMVYTLPNWFFGETYSGDITDEGNIRSLVDYCKTIADVDLVTCDGSIDCLDKPQAQEEYVSQLHTVEFITSLALLREGGSMLIKLFTFFELSTVSLLFVLNCCFEQVHIFKPSTSKEGNSEVYVICLNFRRNLVSNTNLIEHLLKNFKREGKSMLPLSAIPHDFLDQVTNAARFFMNQQVAVIENNIRTFRKYDKREYERIKMIKFQMVEEYIKLYRMQAIDESQKLLHGVVFNTDINLNERVHRGSHLERLSFQNVTKNEQLQILCDRLRDFYERIPEQPLLPSNKEQNIDLSISPENFIRLIRGKPIERVLSSKFIVVSIFKFFLELRSFLSDLTQEEGTYTGRNFIFHDDNFLSLEMEYFRRTPSYDSYEKDIAIKILNHIYDEKLESFIVEALPLLTQFLVGVILYLASFVFKEVYLDRNSSRINFHHRRDEGFVNLKLLIDALSDSKLSGTVGICDTKFLFTFNHEFYKSIIDFNNHLCLRLCSFYLNNISNQI